MRRSKLLPALVVLLSVAFAGWPALGQATDADRARIEQLRQESAALYQQGEVDDAIHINELERFSLGERPL